MLSRLYRPALGLLTDLYQLTMGSAAFRLGRHDWETVFQLTFRRAPFHSGLTVACGLELAIDYLEHLRFTAEDIEYLASLTGNDGRALLDRELLDALRQMEFRCDVDAVPEGTVVFPQQPLLRVTGPYWQAQLVETALLNILNFSTLIATKAARVVAAAQGDPVLEFGLRRAQGLDGGLSATRAAYIGGCAGTSNVLAGRLWGIPVRGTHAHSWVMCFDDEQEAFTAYARAMPNNCLFVVDTYDTLAGVQKAIEAGRWLRGQGQRLAGIRLDSGDLAALSITARQMLDDAGFADAVIVASNDLDELAIARLKEQGALIGVWGVGTRLVTAYDEPALGGVYKLAAVREPGRAWRDCEKLSEEPDKSVGPGILQVRRYRQNGRAWADMIYDERYLLAGECRLVDLTDGSVLPTLPAGTPGDDLLAPIFRRGRRVYDLPTLDAIRSRVQTQLALFSAGVRRLVAPERYPVGWESTLAQRRKGRRETD